MNKFVNQIRDLFESMTPGARITSGLLLVVAVVSVAFLFQQSATGPDAYLFGGEPQSQSDLNRMTAALAEAGVTEWEIEANRLRVPNGQKDAAIAAIASAGALPADFSSFMDEAISQASALESRHQWELRTKAARENQLSHLISLMPWVEKANVMLDIEERRAFNRKNNASASVFVMPRSGEGIDKARSRNIKQFVAGSLASLTADNVHITSGGSELLSDSNGWFDDPYLQAREELQKSCRTMILDGLSYIPGVRVEVSANVDNLETKLVTESSPGEPAVIRTVQENEEQQTTINDGGGQPGVTANGPGRRGTDESLARENQSRTTRESMNEESTVGFSTSEERYAGYKPKEMYASIAIPRDYVVQIWKQENPESDISELTTTVLQTRENQVKVDVERFVKNILPRLALGEDEYRQVEVVFFDAVQRDPLPEPTLTENALAWAGQYWAPVSMLGLAVFSLLMLRSVVRPDAGDTTDTGLQLDLNVEEPSQPAENESEQQRPKLRLKKGESLKEDLSEMVREDPDSAAAILRSWINNAG